MSDDTVTIVEQLLAMDAHDTPQHACNLMEEAAALIEALQSQLKDAATLEREVVAVLESLGADAVRVREGGGFENLAASLAVSVSKLQSQLKAQRGDELPPSEARDLLLAVYREADNYGSVSEETLTAVKLYLQSAVAHETSPPLCSCPVTECLMQKGNVRCKDDQ